MADDNDRGKVIVLQTPSGYHVAMVLLRPDANAAEGHCVFVVTPKGEQAERSQLAVKLEAYKPKSAGELHFTHNFTAVSDVYKLQHSTLPALVIEVGKSGKGTLREEGMKPDQSLGIAFFAKSATPNKKM